MLRKTPSPLCHCEGAAGDCGNLFYMQRGQEKAKVTTPSSLRESTPPKFRRGKERQITS